MTADTPAGPWNVPPCSGSWRRCARRIDIIVIYKIDRLTRSLADFARLAELLDKSGVSFVSVTQQFNTTTSMGRLMLNVLLSFAQFEREISGERIRDKIAASKKKGMWMGGNVPLGYDVSDRALVISEAEAETVRTIYRLYLELGNVRAVVAEAEQLGLKTKARIGPHGRESGGMRFLAGPVYHILRNPVYFGRIRHRDQTYPGAHEPIIDPETWEGAQRQLAGNRTGERTRPNAQEPSPLAGLIVDATGSRFTPSHTMKAGRRYRYYVDRALITGNRPDGASPRRIPAREIENVVRNSLAGLLNNPARLMEALGDRPDAAKADQAIRRARKLRQELLNTASETWTTHVRPILRQVVLDKDSVRLRIMRDGLRSVLSLPARQNGRPIDADDDTVTELHDLVIPARIRTRGGQIRLVIENQGDHIRREQDTGLIKAVARAHGWFEQLQNGDTSSVRDITKAERVTGSYVSRVLRLAFPAPDIVEAVLD